MLKLLHAIIAHETTAEDIGLRYCSVGERNAKLQKDNVCLVYALNEFIKN